MITASTALQNFLLNTPGSLLYEDLYTFTLVTGQVIRLCSGTFDIKIGGHTFTSLNPKANVSRSRVTTSVGLSVDDTEVIIYADPSAQPVTGVPFIAEFVKGYFDDADVLIERLFMPTYGDTSLGTFIQFRGNVGEITEMDQSMVRFAVNSRAALLNQATPRNLYTPACNNALYDAKCLLNRASFGVGATVLAGSNKSQIIATLSQAASSPAPSSAPSLSSSSPSGVNLQIRTEFVVITYVYAIGESIASKEASKSLTAGQVLVVNSPSSASGVIGWNCYVGDSPGNEMLQNATPISIGTGFTEDTRGMFQGSPPPDTDTSGYFALGVIEFVSGPNAGLSRSVVTYVDGPSTNKTLNIVPPLPNSPGVGDSFGVYPGCDKRMSTCASPKFNNLIHFGGFPWIPEPTTTV